MNFSDEQVRDMLEIKERTLQKIERYQKEIKALEKQLGILDAIVKQSSFVKASSLSKSEGGQETRVQTTGEPVQDAIPITRGGRGEEVVIANAYVTPEQVSIVLEESLDIDAGTPPFKTFFLDRIIGEMRKKDDAEVSNGTIASGSAIDYIVNKNGANIREIIVRNYRQKERIDEIINTAGWSLNKMLENTDK